MTAKLFERLKQQYRERRPSITFIQDLDGDDELGEGSFSKTFAASDGPVPCVVKFSKRPWAADPGVAKERQALLELMLQCNGHPHVVALHFFAEIDGHLATQWERGEMSLEKRLQDCRAESQSGIPRDELLPYMEQAAKGLDFINGKTIVHRDVKPESLLLFQSQVKLIDFGFARLAEIDSVTNSVHGTPVFAPPEAGDGRLNPNVDIYCLAATYIRLRTGEYPFGVGDDLKARKQACQFHTTGLLPHEIEALRGALAADPKQRRFATAAAFVAALRTPPPSPPPVAGKEPIPNLSPRPGTAGRGAGGEGPASGFLDKIRGIVAKEKVQQKVVIQSEAERQASLKKQFEQTLHEQLDAENFPMAFGTVNCLLRGDGKNQELLEVRKFLEERDQSGHARAEDHAGIRFSLIPPGEFLMGSPFDEAGRGEDEFQHRVRITQPFYLGITPVTVGQFKRFVASTGHKTDDKYSWTSPGFNQGENHPVVNVSHEDAMAMVKWLSKVTGKPYALPTEAQWEFSCRAGKNTAYWFGDSIGPQNANFNQTHKGTTPVDKYPANPFGLFDVHGNCWQWCADRYDAKYYYESPVDDPSGPSAGSSFVCRGGGWSSLASYCRDAYRRHNDPARRDSDLGFRVVVRWSPRSSRP